MDDQTPLTPTPLTPEEGEMKPVVPDPHEAAGEPTPQAQEGMRPEAARSGVRPEEDEPLGPMAGLVTTSAAQADAEATDDADADALLASMGVEDEGIEGGQLLGIMAATLISIAALCIAMYFLFFSPALDRTQGLAESDVRYEELEVVQTEGLTKISQFALSADSAYTLPIEAAMASVAAEYGAEGKTAMPRTRAGFNTAVLPTQYAGLDGAYPATTDSTARGTRGRYTTPDLDVLQSPGLETDEEVGVDGGSRNVIQVEPDAE